MQTLILTRGLSAFVSESGFEKVKHLKWSATKIGNTYYARAYAGGGRKNPKCVYMHRLILDAPDGSFVDHIDHDGLNNTEANLRLCSKQQNVSHRSGKPHGEHSSKYIGVTWEKRRSVWVAQITVNGKHLFLGRFEAEADAAKARDSASIKHFGEFAHLNFR